MKQKPDNPRGLLIHIVLFFVFGVITLITIAILSFLTIWMLSEPPFFADFDDSEQVKAFIISEFPLGEATYAEVETALNTDEFGSLYCYLSQTYPTYPRDPDTEQQKTVCEATASKSLIFPGFYRINFYYDNDILVEVESSLEYK